MENVDNNRLVAEVATTGDHSPGPWHLWESRDCQPHRVFIRQGIGTYDVPHFGYINDVSAEALANARLIAAAPDLLSALQRLAFHADNKFLTPQEFALVVKGIAEATIAKAGRTP